MILDFLICLLYNLQEKGMKNIIHKSIWAISLICILISCSQYSADELLSAPEQIEIGGRSYILGSYLWRGFMPICPPDGESLCGKIVIIATDSLPFPSSLDADHVWVINGEDVWDTDLVDRKIPWGQEYRMEKSLKDNGPKWGPEIYVDVVVEIDYSEDGIYLLKADSQWIIKGM